MPQYCTINVHTELGIVGKRHIFGVTGSPWRETQCEPFCRAQDAQLRQHFGKESWARFLKK